VSNPLTQLRYVRAHYSHPRQSTPPDRGPLRDRAQPVARTTHRPPLPGDNPTTCASPSCSLLALTGRLRVASSFVVAVLPLLAIAALCTRLAAPQQRVAAADPDTNPDSSPARSPWKPTAAAATPARHLTRCPFQPPRQDLSKSAAAPPPVCTPDKPHSTRPHSDRRNHATKLPHPTLTLTAAIVITCTRPHTAVARALRNASR
jgi:hypothetical protein